MPSPKHKLVILQACKPFIELELEYSAEVALAGLILSALNFQVQWNSVFVRLTARLLSTMLPLIRKKLTAPIRPNKKIGK